MLLAVPRLAVRGRRVGAWPRRAWTRARRREHAGGRGAERPLWKWHSRPGQAAGTGEIVDTRCGRASLVAVFRLYIYIDILTTVLLCAAYAIFVQENVVCIPILDATHYSAHYSAVLRTVQGVVQ
jgi:hypothetical protein